MIIRPDQIVCKLKYIHRLYLDEKPLYNLIAFIKLNIFILSLFYFNTYSTVNMINVVFEGLGYSWYASFIVSKELSSSKK